MVYLFLRQCRTVSVRKTRGFFAFLLVFSFAVYAQGPVVFEENFESGLGGFLINNAFGNGNGLWHLSASCKVPLSGHTQGAALYYGQDGSCDYNNGKTNQGVVESPYVDLTNYAAGPIELRFKYFLKTEGLIVFGGNAKDRASVEISVNRGPYVVIAHNYSSYDPLVVLTCPTTIWTECVINLSAYAGSTIQLRFGFNTDDDSKNYYDGFFVDDIVVYGPPCEYIIAGDINKDCIVNLADLAAIAENWLLNCYQTPSDPGCVPE